jgi:hypothetical protein
MTHTGLTLRDRMSYSIGVRAKADNGLWSLVSYSDGIQVRVDTTPPTGTIIINGGAAFTSSDPVILTLTMIDQDRAGTGPGAQMAFSNDQVTYTPPEPYTTTKAWTLTPGDGLKSVWVKFRDAAGNWSSPAGDSITLDTVPPSGAITSPPDGTVLGAH